MALLVGFCSLEHVNVGPRVDELLGLQTSVLVGGEVCDPDPLVCCVPLRQTLHLGGALL